MDFYQLKTLPEDQQPAYNSEIYMKIILEYLDELKYDYSHMSTKQARETLLSDLNYQNRSQLKSCISFGNIIQPGDLCYIDFGKAYISEIGYQHFGLVISVFDAKAFVIPMTSNYTNYKQAYDKYTNPGGVKHLMRIGKYGKLAKYSVLFLNDGKYINTARVIEVVDHLDVNSDKFQSIRKRFIATLYQQD